MTVEQINDIIPGIELTETERGDVIKGWTRDIDSGGTIKFYLDRQNCARLAELFAALANELR
jgi:hypothetical protein